VLGALLELLVEPLYLRSLRSDPPRLKVRVQAEGGMAIVRAVVTFACLVLDSGNNGEAALMGFAAGYLAGAAWLAARYIAEYGGFGRRQGVVRDLMLPEGKYKDKDDEDADADSEETRQLAWSNTRQSVVKHVLTEADRLVVGYISPLGDQGGYAVAINYGELEDYIECS
jgi:oligosaccharide translocation protein RFT1